MRVDPVMVARFRVSQQLQRAREIDLRISVMGARPILPVLVQVYKAAIAYPDRDGNRRGVRKHYSAALEDCTLDR